jgi:hypothetical protein
MKNVARRAAVGIFVCVSTIVAAPSLFAWGQTGHQIVATVAARGLSPKAAKQVNVLLAGQSLADVAPLPDQWRKTASEESGWHYVNIPKSDTAYNATRDCPPQQSEVGNDCAVAAIEHYKTVLADTTQSTSTRGQALTFIVHFIGDIHQPLHNANNNDEGGNKVAVTWFGAASHTYPGDSTPVSWNLHSVWDDAIIERTGMSVDAYATHLLAGTKPPHATNGTTIDWANGAYLLAKTNSYVIPAGTPSALGAKYYLRNLPVVNRQLLLAGLRLRSVIETALGGTK